MDVLSLLKKDHREVTKLLDRANECDPQDEQLEDLAGQIERALTVHATIEEKYFYPLLRKRAEKTEDTVDVFEAYTEHDLVKRLIALLQAGRQPDEQFKAEVQVLCESVKHHVKEEESTIFSLAKQTMEQDELDELGSKMERAKQRLLGADGARDGAPKGGTRSAGRKAPARKAARRGAR
ncbi:MAG TPA: hemerythrin domain-containing protein [Candidatus Tumulicola sp.]|nr:hemerythrin domain-containing protein [Candidatus Tumulicola sp.]